MLAPTSRGAILESAPLLTSSPESQWRGTGVETDLNLSPPSFFLSLQNQGPWRRWGGLKTGRGLGPLLQWMQRLETGQTSPPATKSKEL